MIDQFTGPTVTVTKTLPAGVTGHGRDGEGVPASGLEVAGAGTPTQAAIDAATTALRLARFDLTVLHCPHEDPEVRRVAGDSALDQLHQALALIGELCDGAWHQLTQLPHPAAEVTR